MSDVVYTPSGVEQAHYVWVSAALANIDATAKVWFANQDALIVPGETYVTLQVRSTRALGTPVLYVSDQAAVGGVGAALRSFYVGTLSVTVAGPYHAGYARALQRANSLPSTRELQRQHGCVVGGTKSFMQLPQKRSTGWEARSVVDFSFEYQEQDDVVVVPLERFAGMVDADGAEAPID